MVCRQNLQIFLSVTNIDSLVVYITIHDHECSKNQPRAKSMSRNERWKLPVWKLGLLRLSHCSCKNSWYKQDAKGGFFKKHRWASELSYALPFLTRRPSQRNFYCMSSERAWNDDEPFQASFDLWLHLQTMALSRLKYATSMDHTAHCDSYASKGFRWNDKDHTLS